MAIALILGVIVMSAVLLALRRPLCALLSLDGARYSSLFQGATRWHTFIALACAAGFATGLVGALDAAAFAAVAFEAAAFSAGFAVFLSIALLLFLEDLTAEVLAAPRAGLAEARVRLLAPLRLAADVLLEVLVPALLETLFLRVFCDTACARSDRAPVQ